MSATGLDVFDRTIQATNSWLNDIGDEIGSGKHVAWHVLGVVLRALRDALPIEMAARLSAGLPLVMRGHFYDQFRPSANGPRIATRAEMLQHVTEGLAQVRSIPPEKAVAAVLRVLAQNTPESQLAKVRAALPEDIRSLWPDAPGGPIPAAAGAAQSMAQTMAARPLN